MDFWTGLELDINEGTGLSENNVFELGILIFKDMFLTTGLIIKIFAGLLLDWVECRESLVIQGSKV